MIRSILLFLFTIVASSSCDSISSSNSHLSKDPYPDSLFKYHHLKTISNDSLGKDYNKDAIKFDLTELDGQNRTDLTDSIFGRSLPYGAYFYSRQHPVNRNAPILILVEADDYQSVIMLTVSGKKVLDKIELALHTCDAVSQSNGSETVSCRERYSKFLNDSIIHITDLMIRIDNYGKRIESTVTDSLSMDYAIKNTGKVVQMKKDSVRNIK
jgi:hypothetical protein